MNKSWTLAAVLMLGCNTQNVQKGLDAAQDALAVVDVGADALADRYVQSVNALRAHCAGDDACEKKYRVTDEDVSRTTEALEKVSKGYDATAQTLKEVQAAWSVVGPIVETVERSAKDVRD